VISIAWQAAAEDDGFFRYTGKSSIGDVVLRSRDGKLCEFIGPSGIELADTSLQMIVNVNEFIERLNEKSRSLNT